MARGENVPYSPVASVTPEIGSGDDYLHVQASPDAFGAQVGEGMQKLGQATQKVGDEAMDVATQRAQMATEAQTNDVIANQFAPQAAKLRADFYQLQGKDAVAGREAYLQNLQQLRTKFTEDATSPLQKQILGHWMAQHVSQEVDGASRYASQQQEKYEDQSHSAYVSTLSDNIVANYNSPDVVAQGRDMMNAQIMKHGLDRGQPMDYIEEQQRQAMGATAHAVISRAVTGGDIGYAQKFYDANKEVIPGHIQLEIDKTLHAEGLRQKSSNNADALLSGQPISTGGHPQVAQVQAVVARTAQDSGVDPNHALAVAKIESNYGQNVGARGDIGQTGKPAADLSEQAKNMTEELKRSQAIADTATGRPSQPWEQYVCYQQGAGGGPALLKAAMDQPLAKAIDVLNPLYKNQKDATSAIVNNGGNASMTAGQFLDFIKQKYNSEAARAQCDIPEGSQAPAQTPIPADQGGAQPVVEEQAKPNLADAIEAPSKIEGIPVQPGSSPVQNLMNLDRILPDAYMRAQAIPNLDERQATIEQLNHRRQVYQASATAWKSQFNNQVQNLAIKPDFTSMDQVPVEIRSAFSDDPQMMGFLQRSAEHNLDKASGGTKEAKEYGPSFWKLFRSIHADPGAEGRITDVSQLYEHAGNDITMAGFDKLKGEIAGKGTAEGAAEGDLRKETFKVVRGMLTGSNDAFGFKDAKGDEIYAHAMPLMYKALDDGKAKGIPMGELYDPQSKNWIGNVAKGMKRSLAQQMADMKQDSGGVNDMAGSATRNLRSIIMDVRAGKLSDDEGRREAAGLGFIRQATSPEVPMSGAQ